MTSVPEKCMVLGPIAKTLSRFTEEGRKFQCSDECSRPADGSPVNCSDTDLSSTNWPVNLGHQCKQLRDWFGLVADTVGYFSKTLSKPVSQKGIVNPWKVCGALLQVLVRKKFLLSKDHAVVESAKTHPGL